MKVGIVTPLDPHTGISVYSGTLAIELQKLGEEVSIISPEINFNELKTKQKQLKFISPENYEVEDFDITHFQLANSYLHEFQLHILEDHRKKLKSNSNIVTTIHDARNFDVFDMKCLKCLSYGLHYLDSVVPYNIVDKGFQGISNYLIFHSKSAMKEYKTRFKLNNESLKCIQIPAYRQVGTHPLNKVEIDLNENRLLVPGYISPFKGQDILIKAVSGIEDDIKLIFMGKITDENYGVYLNRLVEKEGVGDKIEFLGFVSDDKFIEELDKAKTILIPRLMSPWFKDRSIFKFRKILGLDYLINQSTSGVLTMALASGKPIICSKNQGFSDYIDSSRGIFCDDDVVSWRNAIKYILENPEKVKEMSLNSKKFANEALNPTLIAKKHLKLYNELLK